MPTFIIQLSMYQLIIRTCTYVHFLSPVQYVCIFVCVCVCVCVCACVCVCVYMVFKCVHTYDRRHIRILLLSQTEFDTNAFPLSLEPPFRAPNGGVSANASRKENPLNSGLDALAQVAECTQVCVCFSVCF